MISDATREFVDDIDDPVIKMELIHLMATVDAIHAGTGGDLRSEEFVRAFDRSMEGYMQQVAKQKESINRLLDERRQLMAMCRNLQTQLNYANASNRPRMVGPE
jgi:hypothetical protein